ncbi:MAG: hypothetical protein J5632_02255 [Bacteroidales bacterium]|nr:hypothetical protein [Bacteroidales bacterium]
MADNFLEKQYDAAFGKDAGRESVSIRHGLVIRKRGGKIVSVKKLPSRQDPPKAR